LSGNGLRGMTLPYAHEVRSEAEYFSDIPEIKLPDEMLRIAEHILETKAANSDAAFLVGWCAWGPQAARRTSIASGRV
jgi:DNA end-binding protein Ku